MATELEIKLTLSEQSQTEALAWLLAQQEASEGPRKVLMNRYYDTPSAALNRARAALRVREAGGRYIQTLKTQGEFVDGAHRREEWEWEIPSTDLDVSLLEQTPLNDQLDLSELALVFETNFTRQIVMLNTAGSVIEVAVDSGEIAGRGAARPLHEVEFELKSGNSESLMIWAAALAREVPVFLNLVSKAEQGYHLAGIHQPTLGRSTEALSVTEFLHQLSLAWLLKAPALFSAESLSEVQRFADDAGFSDVWGQLMPELVRGCCVADMLQSIPRIGELQLAIAAAS
ncbi:MAG: CYTH domain-containing protein [Gammaproteobacteria bacterium]|uniref:CYTH domain protein n=1 Tax=Marinobacter litoralis TaxID=187981 RepID=A0A3M2R9H6_9GAMM|nr:CYTH domain-containing protein [Marinobacter litoralis]MBR9871036.1 CYTH domain-containing protein [Gammaproteobacteria bacterium]RMJ01765.1 CYTH domain protein [Marinobacter litoralis]